MDQLVHETQYGNFLNLPPEHSDPNKAKVVVLPIPYEKTTSYGKGTSNGPQAIINASAQVEFYDPETRRELCFEHGIATLPGVTFSDPECDLGVQEHRRILQEQILTLIDRGKFIVTLGGEHTVSICSIPVHAEKYPGMSLLQIDAHADMRIEYEGTEWSHACIMRRLTEQFIDPMQLVQVGIRAYSKEEADHINNRMVRVFPMHQIRDLGQGVWQKRVVEKLSHHVYVSLDVDGLDPSIMPATGTPVPGGLMWKETVDLFRFIKSTGRTIVGLDVVELAPNPAHPHCDFTAAQLIYKILDFAL